MSLLLQNSLLQHDNFNENLDSGDVFDSLDNLSSKEESTNSASTTIFQNNKSNQKRPLSWTNPFFNTYRLEKKRKCNVLIKVQNICKAINQSMLNHWDKPKEEGLIASYLDLLFKSLHFLNSENRTKIIDLLHTKIIESSDLCIYTAA
ncbi:28499_t:CDS:2, partial [Gigaspora margarita]